MSQQQDSKASSAATPLERALDQNESIKGAVETSASELAVINAVLKQEIPDPVKKGEIAQALKKTDEMESRIQDAAQDLAQVNQALEAEIGERIDLERELKVTKAALADANEKVAKVAQAVKKVKAR